LRLSFPLVVVIVDNNQAQPGPCCVTLTTLRCGIEPPALKAMVLSTNDQDKNQSHLREAILKQEEFLSQWNYLHYYLLKFVSY
jgi:hypothetical protein